MNRALSRRDALAFDLTVERAYDKAKRTTWKLAMSQCKSSDGLTTAMLQLLQGLALIYGDQ
jgi:hypothetical protein